MRIAFIAHSVALLALVRHASAALPDCKPETVLKAASGERQAMILHALDFYSFDPDYSQSACLNVVSGVKESTSGAYSGGCSAAGEWWRTDCSGYASFVWGLSKSYNCLGLGTKGTDSAGHSWTSTTYAALQPGDALNKTDQHIMIFTGWLNAAHTVMCTIQELNDTQYDAQHMKGCTTWPWKLADLESTSPVYSPIMLTDTSRFNPDPAQSSANDFITLVNWPDGHAEAFTRTASGDLVHMSSQSGDAWSTPVTLESGVECGSTVDYWPHILPLPNQAEVFSPRSGGGASHLGSAGGTWTPPSPLGVLSLSHFQSVAHFDGNLDVFALGADGAIYSNVSDRWAGTWSDWQSLGGSFRTGASAIVWNDGHTELFATGTDGTPQHDWTVGAAWHGWAPMPMQGELLSRPVPVRWPDGHVEVFATGADNKLQHASSTGSDWSAFEDVDATIDIAGDPSPIMNIATPAGPEVFARSMTSGQVVHLSWDGSKYSAFTPLLAQTTIADPMGWVRKDGTAEVFAVDAQHELVHSRHEGANWSAWASIGVGIDACVAKASDPPPTPSPGEDAGRSGVPDDHAPAGCSCAVPTGGGASSSALGALVAALVLGAARRLGVLPVR